VSHVKVDDVGERPKSIGKRVRNFSKSFFTQQCRNAVLTPDLKPNSTSKLFMCAVKISYIVPALPQLPPASLHRSASTTKHLPEISSLQRTIIIAFAFMRVCPLKTLLVAAALLGCSVLPCSAQQVPAVTFPLLPSALLISPPPPPSNNPAHPLPSSRRDM
jgi:hypothetical protein